MLLLGLVGLKLGLTFGFIERLAFEGLVTTLGYLFPFPYDFALGIIYSFTGSNTYQLPEAYPLGRLREEGSLNIQQHRSHFFPTLR